MKINLSYLFCTLVLYSCGKGNNDGTLSPKEKTKELSAFNLVFPDNNLICTEGVDAANGKVSIDFMWTVSENAISYGLEVKNLDTNEIVNTSSTTTSKEVTLPKDTQFSWKVTAILDNKTQESAQWNFYSEGIAEENFAPFPADITVSDNKNGTVNIAYGATDLDDDIENYNIYFGLADNLELVAKNKAAGVLESQSISYNTIYNVTVVTKDSRGNSSTNKTQFNFQS